MNINTYLESYDALSHMHASRSV